MRIVPRSEWGFDGWLGGVAPEKVPTSDRTEFFVHYEGGVPVGHQLGPSVPLAIHHLHRDGNGWKGIGYSFVVTQDGVIYEGRGWDYSGAHCPDHNWSGWAVQIHIGGDEKPSDAALHAARWLYDEACKRRGMTLAKRGHRDGYATECPGVPLYAWVQAGMPDPTNVPEEDPMADPKVLAQLDRIEHFVRVGVNDGRYRLPARIALVVREDSKALIAALKADIVEAVAAAGVGATADQIVDALVGRLKDGGE